MKVIGAVKQDNGCCFYRTVLPMEYMPWAEEDVMKIAYNDKVPLLNNEKQSIHIEDIDSISPDILFFNRTISGRDNLDWYKEQKKKGIKIVTDMDDYWVLTSSHPMYKQWQKYNMSYVLTEILTMSDVIFTTNERLSKKIREVNKNCIVVPNAVPYGERHYIKENTLRNTNKMNFLYAGGSTHYPDVSLLRGKFERIGTDSGIRNKAIFSLAGYNPVKTNFHCDWDKMASIFKRTGSCQILETKPIEDHMSFYDTADVVLVPMAYNIFNQYRSVLKIIEASTRELPCIVSAEWPYLELKDLPGILWVNNNKEWITHIKYCINNPNFVRDQGRALAEEMKKRYYLPTWAKTRYQVFEHLLSK